MTIAAKDENGIFRPLEDVKIKEGTVVEVLIPVEDQAARKRPSIKIFPFMASGRTAPISATASIT